jgi:hypothetical protein
LVGSSLLNDTVTIDGMEYPKEIKVRPSSNQNEWMPSVDGWLYESRCQYPTVKSNIPSSTPVPTSGYIMKPFYFLFLHSLIISFDL